MVNGATGLRFVSISGDVNAPGVYEVPFGQTVRELITLAGGVRGGRTLKAIAPSGPSSGFLPAVAQAKNLPEKFVQARLQAGAATYDILDLPLDSATLAGIGSMLGAAFVVYSDAACMVDNALNCTAFFRNESCGKCVPCRVGTEKAVVLLDQWLAGQAAEDTPELLRQLDRTLGQTSICGLGQVALLPVVSILDRLPPTRPLRRS